MRTRDEQIEDLTNLFGEEGTFSFVDDRNAATKHILEAERRAEQRVRAEISERVSKLFDSYGAYDRPCKQFVMEAIDVSMEEQNNAED